ncbi:hypothetical protein Pelo_7753 [Pelomyxa schiedti]|nr:hypothetical protein Pelo_7753 [Pelomyxa schiedti]
MPHKRNYANIGSVSSPSLDNFVKFYAKTSSRDKLLRLAQFASRLILQFHGGPSSQRAPRSLTEFYHEILITRKVISLGGWISEIGKLSVALASRRAYLAAAASSVARGGISPLNESGSYEVPRASKFDKESVMLVLASAGTFVYLLFDNLCFLSRYTQVLQGVVDAERMGMISARGLLFGNLVVSVMDTRSLVECVGAIRRHKKASRLAAISRSSTSLTPSSSPAPFASTSIGPSVSYGPSTPPIIATYPSHLGFQRNMLMAVLVKNVCDVLVSGYYSELWYANPGFISVLGVLSSAIAVFENWVTTTSPNSLPPTSPHLNLTKYP